MRTMLGAATLAATLTLVGPAAAYGQVSFTPLAGGYIPASSFADLEGGARTAEVEREAALALGLNVGLGSLRATVRYVTDAKLSERGVDDTSRIESGTLLAAAADLVLRPLPRVLGVQPYLLGGAGLKRMGYSYADDGLDNPFPDDEREWALHLGLGVDLMAGGLGIVVEVDDFVGLGDAGAHDAFVMAGLRLSL
ncbi:MAG TPA: hypothetical protein VMK65_06820 [Longimicrobiales bacterium]|nr:hypothetical protein [Longimicrobiales bacterium]